MNVGRWLVDVAVGVVVAMLVVWLATPSRYFSERRKANQHLAPLDYRDRDLLHVLQGVLNKTDGRVEITLCEGLASVKVTLLSQSSETLSDVLDALAMQIEGEYRAYPSHHGVVFRPRFTCPSGEHVELTIRKTQSAN